jgi:hypothetical protein
MKLFAILLAGAMLSLSAAQAVASHYTTYIQRQRGETLIIEHNPVPSKVVRRGAYRAKVLVAKRKLRQANAIAVRRAGRRAKASWRNAYRSSSIAGGCWDGGLVRRRGPGGKLVTLQREICGGIAENLPTPNRW